MEIYNLIDESKCFFSYSNTIHRESKIDAPFIIGAFNVIGKVVIKESTTIEHHCVIKDRTEIGKQCRIESGCKFSGDCKIGDNCHLKQNVTIARNCDVGDRVFISPNVVFLYSDHEGNASKKKTKVGNGVFIGAGAVILPEVEIADEVVIGAGAVVTKSLTTSGGIYVGVPAKMKGKK